MSYLQNFHYQITGEAPSPKMVFLHGVTGYSANWRPITKAFEDQYQVLVFDQRGHGRSFKPASGYAPEDYADDLRLILDELGWKEIVLIGHSMGGRNAMNFAARFPERVTRLVIEDIGPGYNIKGADRVLNLVQAVPVPFESKRAARQFFDTEFVEMFKDRPQIRDLALYFYANIIEDEQKRGVWRFSREGVLSSIEEGRRRERWDEIQSLAMPTLLVRGAESEDLPHETYVKVLESNPNIQGVEIPEAGHWVHSDQPAAFIRAVQDFLGGALVL